MLSAKTLLSIFFGFVILAGAVSVLAEELETTTINGVEFHLVPQEWVVNYAHNLITEFWKGEGISIGDSYLAIPVYGMEDQILSYIVIFSKSDSIPSSLDDLYRQQYEENKPLLKTVDYYLNGQIDYKYLAAEMGKNISGLYMNDKYAGGSFHNLLEFGPVGTPNQGIPTAISFYWLAVKYLENKYEQEPVFKCFRITEELGFCYEFMVGEKDLVLKMDPYFFNIRIMNANECHSIDYSQKIDPKLLEERKIDWQKYSSNNNGIEDSIMEAFTDWDQLPFSSNYYQCDEIGYPACTWVASSNVLSWINYIGYEVTNNYWHDLYPGYTHDWVSYAPGYIAIFSDQDWGNQTQYMLYVDSGYDYSPSTFEEINDAWDETLSHCGYDQPGYHWDYTNYGAYLFGDPENLWWNKLKDEISGNNEEFCQIPLWCAIPLNGYEYVYGERHSVAVVGYKLESGKRYILVNDGGFGHTYYPILWWADNPSFTPKEDDDFCYIIPHPKLAPGVFCTLAYFLGTAGANNVELGFSCDSPPDPSFQGFQLYRANNKSGPWILMHTFSPTEWCNIRYTDTPPTNEKFFYIS